MQPEVKEAWLKALRSGEYQQGTGCLRKDDTYCCLGVLCDVYDKQEVGLGESRWKFVPEYKLGGLLYGEATVVKAHYRYQDQPEILPYDVKKWAGLKDRSPSFVDDTQLSKTLAALNDDGYTFNQIADVIEKHF
jgi:hypothetical protein